jgi:hypothetical protein
MEAIVLNGGGLGDHEVDGVHRVLVDEFQSLGYRTTPFLLREVPIASCTGCFGCWVKHPGSCAVDDAGREIAALAARSDVLAIVTPVTFGGYSSHTKRALERLIPLISPFFERIGREVHHRARYRRYPSLLAIGVSPFAEDESHAVFRRLVERNGVNMHVDGHAAAVVSGAITPEQVRAQLRLHFDKLGMAVA